MNEELQTRLSAYLDAIESSASVAGDFVVEQTPLVAQEYLAWVFWSSSLYIALSTVALVITALAMCFGWVASRNATASDKEFFRMLIVFFGGILLAVFGLVAWIGCESIIKVTVAPRVVLLEKIAEVMP